MSGHAEEVYWRSEWVGAILVWCVKLGGVNFSAIQIKANEKRNVLIGYFFQLSTMAGIIALLFYIV